MVGHLPLEEVILGSSPSPATDLSLLQYRNDD